MDGPIIAIIENQDLESAVEVIDPHQRGQWSKWFALFPKGLLSDR